jgi:hypothetical protein
MITLKHTLVALSILGISEISMAQWTGSSPIKQLTTGNVIVGNNGINLPNGLLQVRDGSIIFEGTLGSIPNIGAGTRLMWYPAKRAFRAGSVTGTLWDDVSIGTNSFASGNDIVAPAFCQFSVGQFSLNPGSPNATTWIGADPLFVIGNGTSTSALSNAITVLKNGNTGIGTATPSTTLEVVSNAAVVARLKGSASSATSNCAQLRFAGGKSGDTWAIGTDVSWASGTKILEFQDLTYNTTRLAIMEDGKVAVGTMAPSARLTVNSTVTENALDVSASGTVNFRVKSTGYVYARDLTVQATAFPDYVFAKTYKLMPLAEVNAFIQKNSRLPEMPSAAEVEKDGMSVSQVNTLLVKKSRRADALCDQASGTIHEASGASNQTGEQELIHSSPSLINLL